MSEKDDLKLIYILKVGQNTKKENIFEFIFSKDESNVDYKKWGWDILPANENADPPSEDYIDEIVTIKTDEFNLFCLHDATDREYLHGYYNIHALAYEWEDEENENLYPILDEDDIEPILVFLYGMSFNVVKVILYSRNIRI
jgi:hypothetical protein